MTKGTSRVFSVVFSLPLFIAIHHFHLCSHLSLIIMCELAHRASLRCYQVPPPLFLCPQRSALGESCRILPIRQDLAILAESCGISVDRSLHEVADTLGRSWEQIGGVTALLFLGHSAAAVPAGDDGCGISVFCLFQPGHGGTSHSPC